MGAKTPAAGEENKPFVKNEGQPNVQHGGQNNNNRCDNIPRMEKFLGADPNPNKPVQNKVLTSQLLTKVSKHKSELNVTYIF